MPTIGNDARGGPRGRRERLPALKPEEAAWLAGLLEGEGCFYESQGRPHVQLKMTDQDVVVDAAVMMGVKQVKEWHPAGRKTSYAAVVTGRRAAAVMRSVYPYMGARRREKIDELLSGYKYA